MRVGGLPRAMGAACALLAYAAAPASAHTVHFASPTGSPTATCEPGDPCDLVTAVATAASGISVGLMPGTYDLRGRPTVVVRTDITLRGGRGGEPAVLLGDHADGVLSVRSPGALVGGIEIVGTARGLDLRVGTAEHMIVRTTAGAGIACDVGAGTVRSSVCWARGPEGTGLTVQGDGPAPAASDDAAVVGSTLAGKTGVRVHATSPNAARLRLDSSIALGGPGGHDIEAGGGAAQVTTSFSNFDDAVGSGIVSLGGDQSAPPALADPARGDFHQLEGSATIDTGAPGDMPDHGAGDLDGDPRVIGAAVDIGADEHIIAPEAQTTEPLGVTASSAGLHGELNANAASADYWFEWWLDGTTAGPVGTTSPATTIGSSRRATASPVSAPLGDLQPGTRYAYRLMAANAAGTVTGAVQRFTTAGVPPEALGGSRPPGEAAGAADRTPGAETSAAGTAPGAPRALRISGVRVRHASGRRLQAHFRLSTDATVDLRVFRVRPRPRLVGQLRMPGRAGTNQTPIPRRLVSGARSAGRYRLVVVAAGARPARTTFAVGRRG